MISEKVRFMPESSVIDNKPIVSVAKEGVGRETYGTVIVSFGKPEGPGGLTRGVAPLLHGKGGGNFSAAWIFAGEQNGNGEHGGAEEALRTTEKTAEGHEIAKIAVPLQKDDKDRAYLHTSNNILWPALHDLPQRIEGRSEEPQDFAAYQKVQRQFAEVVGKAIRKDTFTLINDYQLAGVALELRKKGFTDEKLAFFLHTPFPKSESFQHLHLDIQKYFLEGLLAHDYIGFQTQESKQNFLDAVKIVLNPAEDVFETSGDVTYLTWNGRRVRVEDNPIGIDTQAFQEEASKPSVREKTEALKEKFKEEFVYFYLGRRDYTKGIPQFIEAIDLMLEKHPDLIKKVRFLIAAPPTRPDLAQYQKYSIEVETLIREINEKYKKPNSDWSPIVFEPEGLGGDDLFASYGVANALVTPSSADGFILAVPEAISAWQGQGKDDGVIITGATIGANQVYGDGVFTVTPQRIGTERISEADRTTDNPVKAFNEREEEKVEAFADTLYQAFAMPENEKRENMNKLREINRNHNVDNWGGKIRRGAMSDLPAAA